MPQHKAVMLRVASGRCRSQSCKRVPTLGCEPALIFVVCYLIYFVLFFHFFFIIFAKGLLCLVTCQPSFPLAVLSSTLFVELAPPPLCSLGGRFPKKKLSTPAQKRLLSFLSRL